jgi:Domain of unknown function (DUF4386)
LNSGEEEKLQKAEVDENALGASRIASPSLLAVSGFVTGVLVLIAFLAETISPSPPSPGLLNYALSQSDLALFSFRSFAWALFAIAAVPFFAIVGRSFHRRNADGAWVATLTLVMGIVLYALRGILQDSAFAAAGTTAAPSAADAAYQANLLYSMVNPLLPLGGALWGLGFVLFGILARKSGILPTWLALVAIVGGVAGWAIFPVLNSNAQFIGYLFTELLLPFTTAIWCFAFGVGALRQK